jgi:hypothetical protein
VPDTEGSVQATCPDQKIDLRLHCRAGTAPRSVDGFDLYQETKVKNGAEGGPPRMFGALVRT